MTPPRSRPSLPTLCLLAGGVGSRLGGTVRHTPKPLLDVAGEPFMVHQLRLLAAHGAREVVVCVGYLGERIIETIGAQRFGIRIVYSHDGPKPIGTLAAIRRAAPLLGDRFLVLYGDTYLRIDYGAVAAAWKRSGLPAMMTVLLNEGRWDVSNVSFDGERVISYEKRRPTPTMRWIDYGLGGLDASVLDAVDARATDVADLYVELVRQKLLFGFAASHRFYEIGNPESLAETRAFFTNEPRLERSYSRRSGADHEDKGSSRRS